MKKLPELAIILVRFGISSWAQEVRHEATVQGSGFFNKQSIYLLDSPASSLLSTLQGGCFSHLDS